MAKLSDAVSKTAFREIQQAAAEASGHGSDNVLEATLRRRVFGRSTSIPVADLEERIGIEIAILEKCLEALKRRK